MGIKKKLRASKERKDRAVWKAIDMAEKKTRLKARLRWLSRYARKNPKRFTTAAMVFLCISVGLTIAGEFKGNSGPSMNIMKDIKDVAEHDVASGIVKSSVMLYQQNEQRKKILGDMQDIALKADSLNKKEKKTHEDSVQLYEYLQTLKKINHE